MGRVVSENVVCIRFLVTDGSRDSVVICRCHFNIKEWRFLVSYAVRVFYCWVERLHVLDELFKMFLWKCNFVLR